MRKSNIIRLGASKGFTLIEMIVVVVIVGILAVMINSTVGSAGVSAATKSEQKYDAVMKLVQTWGAVAQFMNVSPDPDNSTFFRAAAHTAMDVLIPQDPENAISAAYSARYLSSSPVKPLTQFQVITNPTAAAAGVYAIGDPRNTVSIAYNAATREMSVTIQAVPADEVRSMMETKEGSASGTSYTTTARTTGTIRYTALDAANNTHNLTIVRRI